MRGVDLEAEMRVAWMGVVLMACSGSGDGPNGDEVDTDSDPTAVIDPMVGDWQGVSMTTGGDTYALPHTEGGETTALEMSFTEEPRGLLRWRYTDAGGSETVDTFEFVVDIFTEGNWLLEIEDGGSDMIQDCTADATTLQCFGSCDGSDGCNFELVRAD